MIDEVRDLLARRLGARRLDPDEEGRLRLRFRGGLELVLVPAGRGRLVAEVVLGPLPGPEGPRGERLRLVAARALAMMKAAEEVVALDEGEDRLLLWRYLDLPALAPSTLEEQVARLLDRAEWLASEARAAEPARPVGPMILFP